MRQCSRPGSAFRVSAGQGAAPEGFLFVFQWINRARRPVSRVLSGALPPVDSHSSGTPVAGRLARPTRESGAGRRLDRLPGPILLSGLAPGGVCRAGTVTGPAVRSYRTVSPLPQPRFPRGLRRSVLCGTVPEIALAGRYPAPSSRGARTFLHRREHGPRRQRPSSRLARGLARSAALSCQSGRPGSPSFPGLAPTSALRDGNAGRRPGSRPWRWPGGRHWAADLPGR